MHAQVREEFPFLLLGNKVSYYQIISHLEKLRIIVHENLAIYSHNPEVRYIEFLLMDSGSELSPEQDPVVWKILNFGHLALNSAN